VIKLDFKRPHEKQIDNRREYDSLNEVLEPRIMFAEQEIAAGEQKKEKVEEEPTEVTEVPPLHRFLRS